MSLSGKHGLVTGSSHGIGRGIALELAAEGAPVGDDVANVVALLCSEEAGWITGQVIYADGGASLVTAGLPPALQQRA